MTALEWKNTPRGTRVKYSFAGQTHYGKCAKIRCTGKTSDYIVSEFWEDGKAKWTRHISHELIQLA